MLPESCTSVSTFAILSDDTKQKLDVLLGATWMF